MHATLLLQVAVLLVGSVVFSVMYENIVANGAKAQFSLPLSNMLIVVVVGAGLSVWWGWTAVAGVLAAYGAWCALAGWLGR